MAALREMPFFSRDPFFQDCIRVPTDQGCFAAFGVWHLHETVPELGGHQFTPSWTDGTPATLIQLPVCIVFLVF